MSNNPVYAGNASKGQLLKELWIVNPLTPGKAHWMNGVAAMWAEMQVCMWAEVWAEVQTEVRVCVEVWVYGRVGVEAWA